MEGSGRVILSRDPHSAVLCTCNISLLGSLCGGKDTLLVGIAEVMGGNPQVVDVVAEQCKAHRVAKLIVDPVLVSTSGHSLGDSEVASALKKK